MPNNTTGIGVGVDRTGGPVIDPTENVRQLVLAESKYQDAMRDAETRRINELAVLRQTYETRIANMLSQSVERTSGLISTQLVQIQQTISDRVAKLEQFRWETGGKTSVSDPAISDALDKMARHVNALTISGGRSDARGMGRGEIVSYIAMGVLVLANIATIVALFIALRGH